MKKKTAQKGKVRSVIQYGDPKSVLRKKAKKVAKLSEIKTLVDDLIVTCKAANLVGIAAPQINVSKQVIIVWQQPTKTRPELVDTGPKVLINPKIIAHSSATQFGYEGCGSLPGIMAKVRRYKSVQMEYVNHLTGKKEIVDLKDFEARIAQHEYEHLQGGSFLDTADIKTVITIEEFQRLSKKKK